MTVRSQNSLQRISEKYLTIRDDFQQQTSAITALASNLDALQQELLLLKTKLEDLHYATYNGSLIWKIDDFAEKCRKCEEKIHPRILV